MVAEFRAHGPYHQIQIINMSSKNTTPLPFGSLNGHPAGFGKAETFPRNIRNAVPYLLHRNLIPFFLQSRLDIILRIKDSTSQTLLDYVPNSLDRVQVWRLYRVLEGVDFSSSFILLYKTFLSHARRRVAILLQKPLSWCAFGPIFDSFNVDR